MTYTRRDLGILVAALAASPAMGAEDSKLQSKTLPYDAMPVHKRTGAEARPVLSGELHNGCSLEVHQTRLSPGSAPHPPHHHRHEEMFLIREGTLEVTISGQATQLGPGSVGFVGSNDEHGVRNTGTTPTEYFVVAFGKDA